MGVCLRDVLRVRVRMATSAQDRATEVRPGLYYWDTQTCKSERVRCEMELVRTMS